MEKLDIFNQRPLALAPMAGVSDVGFRAVAASFGADITYTEMLSAQAIVHSPSKTSNLAKVSKEEKFKIAQIFGHDKVVMAKALKNSMFDPFDVIDINMGCPAPKIFGEGDGCALMQNLSAASQIIETCKKATTKPVSVKFRLGIKNDCSREFGKMCEESGASFITLHARTKEQGYSGYADYEAIATLVANVKIPVIGSGDVTDSNSLALMWQTGASGVMIGRGSMGRPWIFAELKGRTVTAEQKYAAICHHVEVMRGVFSDDILSKLLCKHFLWYSSSLPCSREARMRLALCKNIEESLQILKGLLFCGD